MCICAICVYVLYVYMCCMCICAICVYVLYVYMCICAICVYVLYVYMCYMCICAICVYVLYANVELLHQCKALFVPAHSTLPMVLCSRSNSKKCCSLVLMKHTVTFD